MKSLLADIKVNEDNLSILVILTYRYGNWIYYNVKLFGIRQLLLLTYKMLYLVIRIFTSSEIPATCKIGQGFRLEHGGNGIIIHGESIIGDNARIFHQVTLGINTFDKENYGAPIIGNNAYIGAGVKIIGHVKVGDNVRIGANAVVTKDIPSSSTAVGIPARILQQKSVKEIM